MQNFRGKQGAQIMVYVKMVNIVTLMASLGIIKKRVYAIRKLKWTNP